MAYTPGSNKFGSNNKFSSNKPAVAVRGEKKEPTPTSHVMVTAKDEKGDSKLISGIFIRENEYGLSISVAEATTLEAGQYFINKKKDKRAVNQ